jgi:hypothetical protein
MVSLSEANQAHRHLAFRRFEEIRSAILDMEILVDKEGLAPNEHFPN